jgi:tetratricopeptide (TPR) repeat protein
MDINEKNVNININVKDGGVINFAKDNGTIISSQYTGKNTGKVEEPIKLIIEEEKNRIHNLFKRNELKEAEERLKEFELTATTNSDAFFISLNLGKCYLLISEKQIDRSEKEQNLRNAMHLLEQAIMKCKGEKQEDIYEMYYIYMNICLRLGELLEDAEYYKKGIELYEDNKLEKKLEMKIEVINMFYC